MAASRRSDRGLEARMESARRASAIHEKRTGRALRITEADIINEEMYGEINDLPTEYHRLNAYLHTQSAEFDRRLLAYLSCQMAMRQAVSNCWQNEQSHLDTRGVNFGTLQEPPSIGPPASPAAGNMINDRQKPYPTKIHDVPWAQHGHSGSLASTYVPGFDQQYPQAMFSSPHSSGRHMSLPSDTTMQPRCPSSGVPMDTLSSNNMPRVDSAVDMTNSPQNLQHPTLHNINDSKYINQSWQAHNGLSIEPLSTALPLDGQQFLTSSPQALHPHASHQPMSSPYQKFTHRRYSYNPNGKQKIAQGALPHLHTNQSTAPLSSGQRSSTNHGSRPSTSYGGALSQICYDANGMGPDGTFTRNPLEETDDTIPPRGNSTP